MARLELVAKTAMFTGVLGIGVALGASIGLAELQSSCVAAGKLPTAGSPLFGVDLDANACWTGAKRMQLIANGSGLVGAVLVLGGGVLDAYEERIREVIGHKERNRPIEPEPEIPLEFETEVEMEFDVEDTVELELETETEFDFEEEVEPEFEGGPT